MTALTVAEATAAIDPDAPDVPVLRRLPVPVAEPRAALTVVRGTGPDPSTAQETLPFGDDPDAVPSAVAGALLGRPAGRSGAAGAGPGRSETRGDDPGGRDGATRAEATHVGSVTPGTAVPPAGLTLPDPLRWTRRFVQAAVEVAAGQRPATQLVRWTSEDVLTSLARRGRLSAQRRGTPRPVGRSHPARRAYVLSAHLGYPVGGVIEACAVVNDGGRNRAVALRIESPDGRWRVTAFEIG